MADPSDFDIADKVHEARLTLDLMESIASAHPEFATLIRGRLGNGAVPFSLLSDTVVDLLDDGNGRIRPAAVTSLGLMVSLSLRIWGCAPPSVTKMIDPLLLILSQHQDTEVRIAAIQTLAEYGRQASARVVTAITSMLEDDDVAIQVGAANALQSFGPELASAAVPELIRLLDQNSNQDVSLAVCSTLRWLGSEASAAVRALLQRITCDSRDDVQTAAALALVAVTRDPRVVADQLHDEHELNRLVCVLREIGSIGTLLRKEVEAIGVQVYRTREELAKALGVDVKTVHRWQRTGTLPQKRDGVYPITPAQIRSLQRPDHGH